MQFKISAEVVDEAVRNILALSEKKKRKFVETIELQVALKNIPRFPPGSVKLPNIPRDRFKVCVFGTDQHCEDAKEANIACLSVADLMKFNKNKKLIKKLGNHYDAFLASNDLIRKIPRLLGPAMAKFGNFPSVLNTNETLQENVDNVKCTVKFRLRKYKSTSLGISVGNVALSQEQNVKNVMVAIDFLVSLLPKGYEQISRLYLKSTMGPSHWVFGR